MDYVWRKRSSPLREKAWMDRLGEWGPRLVVTESVGRQTVRLELYCSTWQEAASLRERFGGTVKRLESTDWTTFAGAKPILVKIRDRLIITSARSAEALATLASDFPGRDIITIPPELAFGTGDHATTATCLRLLVDDMTAPQRKNAPLLQVLDLGTGTAILAIAAKKLGADRVEAWDCDPLAIDVARRNVEANDCSGGIIVRQRDILSWNPDTARWSLITANLFSEVLRPLFPVLRRALQADGSLIVSGMLFSQTDETLGAARDAGFAVTRTVKRGRWISAHCT